MRLNVEHFAKLKKADIALEGITVIAGENNTGKSTIGKILFSIINSLSNLDEKIEEQQKDAILKTTYNILADYITQTHNINETLTQIDSTKINTKSALYRLLLYYDKLNGGEEFWAKISKDNKAVNEDYFKDLPIIREEDREKIKRSIQEKKDAIMKIPTDKIALELLTRYFGKVFNMQINSLLDVDYSAKVSYQNGSQCIEMIFENNECVKYEKNTALFQKAIYIDNPFILDCLDGDGSLNTMDEFLKELLVEARDASIMDGIIESVMAKEKLSDIFKTMKSVIDGEIVEKGNHKFFIKKDGYEEPISFHGLSTGLKSFVLLKLLLEKGILREKDILILDEPEIHLHPQWQVTYAELIVLLQKQFDLTVLVTTHSPYFLDAINLFSIKYETDKKVNYYLAQNEKTEAVIKLVTGNINKIYERMVTPVQQLETLRYELNNQ